MNYREIIESRYNRKNWKELLFDIFRNKAQFWQQPQLVPVDESMAKSAYYTGKITLPDGHTIAIYEVELSDNIIIERNRAGIRNLLCTNWRGMGCSGAFMFCFRQHEAVLRFSYVSESFTFAEDGSLKKDSTDTKRFTYLLGEGHRSRTAIQQFEKLKASGLTLKDITKAFSVEALSDLFFKEYKKQYEDIIEFVTGKRMVKVANKWEERITGEPCREIMQEFTQFPDAEKAVRDYVKKLMGRLVFIQFLQKKGWMGCSAGEAWNDGDREFVQNLFANTTHKNTFIDEVLEPLFNDINTRRTNDLASKWCDFYLLPSGRSGGGLKVPYLNGGLFEHDDYDKTTFPLPAKYMKSLLDFFASYNFTIDENDPDDAEIGVDPEMLGRIFENLLEDNKDKGAFYTPKEIVQYMCRESLIAYLQTDEEDEAVKLQIREFVTTNNADLLSADLAASIDQKLKDVKICDPAIGSGAFPMGLLRELYACRKAIEDIDVKTAVQIKTEIIQNNIYGVDIEKGAVDIARLRFWLALIVDEDTPHALPNMDFKIMQGNSLLEQYEGIDLCAIAHGEKVVRQKAKIKKKLYDMSSQTEFVYEGRDAIGNLQVYLKDYFSITDHQKKEEYKKSINQAVHDFIRVNLTSSNSEVLSKLENLPIPNDQFFLWHIYFKEVFDKGGFDIVIGNPPYIGVKGHRDLFDIVKNGNLGEYFIGKMDYFYFFFHLAMSIVKEEGIFSFITTNYYITADGATKLRRSLYDKTCPLLLFNLGEMKLFENAPGQHNMISMYKCSSSSLPDKCTIIDVHKTGALSEDMFYNIISHCDIDTCYALKCKEEIFDGSENYIRLQSNEEGNTDGILKKISDGNNTLRQICDINQGIVSGADYVSNKHLQQYRLSANKNDGIFVLDENNIRDSILLSSIRNSSEYTLLRSFYKNSDVSKYMTSVTTSKQILFLGKEIKTEEDLLNRYPLVYSHLREFRQIMIDKRESLGEKTEQWFTLNRGTSHPEIFKRPKIVCPQRSKTNMFGFNELEWYAASDVFFITNPQNEINIKYILGILNSKLYFFWLYNKGKRKGETLELTATPLSEIPIKKASDVEQNKIIALVDHILSAKKANPLADTTAEEREIDRLVYALYGLTEDEIAIVEGTT